MDVAEYNATCKEKFQECQKVFDDACQDAVSQIAEVDAQLNVPHGEVVAEGALQGFFADTWTEAIGFARNLGEQKRKLILDNMRANLVYAVKWPLTVALSVDGRLKVSESGFLTVKQ